MTKNIHSVPMADAKVFEKKVINSAKPCIVLFRAAWSGNSHLQQTVLSHIATSYSQLVDFYTVDIDRAKKLVRKFNIQTVPTLLFFKDKELQAFMPGLYSEDNIEDSLQQMLTQQVSQ